MMGVGGEDEVPQAIRRQIDEREVREQIDLNMYTTRKTDLSKRGMSPFGDQAKGETGGKVYISGKGGSEGIVTPLGRTDAACKK